MSIERQQRRELVCDSKGEVVVHYFTRLDRVVTGSRHLARKTKPLVDLLSATAQGVEGIHEAVENFGDELSAKGYGLPV